MVVVVVVMVVAVAESWSAGVAKYTVPRPLLPGRNIPAGWPLPELPGWRGGGGTEKGRAMHEGGQ